MTNMNYADLIEQQAARIAEVESLKAEGDDYVEHYRVELDKANARLTALESERDALLAAAGKEAVPIGYVQASALPLLKRGAADTIFGDCHECADVPLYAAPTAALEKAGGRDAWPLTLYELLMQQNIATSGESYLSLRCVGVPPTQAEFATAVQRTIDAAMSQKAGEQQ